jgi:hypothetical protein
MKTKTIIEANSDNFNFGDWDEETDEFTPIEADNLEEMAEKLQCTPELLDLIRDNFYCLQGDLLEDLKDIWKKLEQE